MGRREKWWQKVLRYLFGIDSRPKMPTVPEIIGDEDEEPAEADNKIHTDELHADVTPTTEGRFRIAIKDMAPQGGRNDNGGWEYGMLSLYGDFGRVLLMQLGGGRKCVRFKVGTAPMQLNIHHDNLPGWHVWEIVADGSQIWIELDG